MVNREHMNRNPWTRRLQAIAARLIGLGGLLVLMPIFWVRSPFGAVTRVFAPFGWLVLLTGFGLLAFQMQRPMRATRTHDRSRHGGHR